MMMTTLMLHTQIHFPHVPLHVVAVLNIRLIYANMNLGLELGETPAVLIQVKELIANAICLLVI